MKSRPTLAESTIWGARYQGELDRLRAEEGDDFHGDRGRMDRARAFANGMPHAAAALAPTQPEPAPAFDIMTWVPPSIADEKAAMLAAIPAPKDNGWREAVAAVNGGDPEQPTVKPAAADPFGWAAIIAQVNRERGHEARDEAGEATSARDPHGWAKAVASTNADRGSSPTNISSATRR